jgi:hypothetical protein
MVVAQQVYIHQHHMLWSESLILEGALGNILLCTSTQPPPPQPQSLKEEKEDVFTY